MFWGPKVNAKNDPKEGCKLSVEKYWSLHDNMDEFLQDVYFERLYQQHPIVWRWNIEFLQFIFSLRPRSTGVTASGFSSSWQWSSTWPWSTSFWSSEWSTQIGKRKSLRNRRLKSRKLLGIFRSLPGLNPSKIDKLAVLIQNNCVPNRSNLFAGL